MYCTALWVTWAPFNSSTKILMCSNRRFVNVLYDPGRAFRHYYYYYQYFYLPTDDCMHLFLPTQVYRVFRCQILATLVKCKKSSIVASASKHPSSTLGKQIHCSIARVVHCPPSFGKLRLLMLLMLGRAINLQWCENYRP